MTEDPHPVRTEPRKPDLTVNKVLAGAGAAATSALLGSYFGAAGTVAGAAFGSVVTTIVSSVYQRSLDRTRDSVLERVRVTRDGRTLVSTVVTRAQDDPEATVPLHAGDTLVGPAHHVPRWLTRRRAVIASGTAVAAFVIGLLAITGVEWITGSPLSGQGSGTSVGRVVTGGGDPAPQEPAGTGSTDSPETTETTAPPTSETTAPVQPGSETSAPTPTTAPTTAPTTPAPTSQVATPAGGGQGTPG